MTRRRRPCKRRRLAREIEWPHKHLTIISDESCSRHWLVVTGLERLDFAEGTTLVFVKLVLEIKRIT